MPLALPILSHSHAPDPSRPLLDVNADHAKNLASIQQHKGMVVRGTFVWVVDIVDAETTPGLPEDPSSYLFGGRLTVVRSALSKVRIGHCTLPQFIIKAAVDRRRIGFDTRRPHGL